MSNLESEQHRLRLTILPGQYAVCRLPPDAPVPAWAEGGFVSVTRTIQELSVVCEQRYVPSDVRCEKHWRGLRVEGPLDLALTGIMASLTAPLAQARIAIFALSTYDTDYLLIKDRDLDAAVRVLRASGFEI